MVISARAMMTERDLIEKISEMGDATWNRDYSDSRLDRICVCQTNGISHSSESQIVLLFVFSDDELTGVASMTAGEHSLEEVYNEFDDDQSKSFDELRAHVESVIAVKRALRL